MTGVLEQIKRPKKQLVGGSVLMSKMDQKVLQLQVAKEILAEIFGTDIQDVVEMLKQRSAETGEWPHEFCLAE